MALFGFGGKRNNGRPQAPSARSKSGGAAPSRAAGAASEAPAQQALTGLEVSELHLDNEDFSSTFGAGASQFAELPRASDAAGDDDPWRKMLRID